MTALQSAKDWVDRGFWPIPVPYGEKNPALVGWQDLRLNEDSLLDYFNGQQQNVGLLLGNEGLSDIDLDCREAVISGLVLLPETEFIFGRPSNPASHLFYRSTPPVVSRRFGDPLDTKQTILEIRCLTKEGGIGLHTLVPSSVHPCGEIIRFETGKYGEPTQVGAESLLQAASRTAASALLSRNWPKKGTRHSALLALGGGLCRAGWPLDETQAFIRSICKNVARRDSDFRPRVDAEVHDVADTYSRHQAGQQFTGWLKLSELVDKRIVNTAIAWLGLRVPAEHRIEVTEWSEPIPFRTRQIPPFPDSILPGFLGDQVAAVATATETPVALGALLALAVTSACIARKFEVSPESGYMEPVNLYAASVMESGNRKTAVLNQLTEPLVEWDWRERERMAPEIRRIQSERKTLEARIEKLRKKAATDATPEALKEITDLESSLPEVPVEPKTWVQDITPEKLGVVMADQGEKIALLSDEGGIFDILAGRYSRGVPNLDLLLQAHAGAAYAVDRGSRPSVVMRRPALTIALSPQPAVLQKLKDLPEFRGRGLLARFFYSLADSPLGYRTLIPCPVPPHVSEHYRQGIQALLRLKPPLDEQGRTSFFRLVFDRQGYEAWKEFQRAVELMMQEGGKLYLLKDWASKLPGQAARIAAVLHGVTTLADGPITASHLIIAPETMERSLTIATLLIDHALAAFDLMQADPTIEDANRLLRWIQRGGAENTFTFRDCFCAHQSRFAKVEAMRPAIALLEEHGFIRRAPASKAAHRPSEVYLVNPAVSKSA